MFGEKAKRIKTLEEVINDLNCRAAQTSTQLSDLRHALEGVQEDSAFWKEQYEELNHRYTMLDSLFKQVRFNITLPIKTAKKGK